MFYGVKEFYESYAEKSRIAAEKITLHINKRASLDAKTNSNGLFESPRVSFQEDADKKFRDLFNIIDDLEFILKEFEAYRQEENKKSKQYSPEWNERNPNYSTPPSDGLR